MEYHANDWLGRWQNFEAYLTSSDPYLTRAWQDAETAAAAMPMFCGGVKVFWQRACVTTSPENPHTLGGWNITLAVGEKLCIEWLDEDGASLGKAVYHLESVLEKGLEGKENALFVAEDMPENWPFRCLLAMEPMPPRTARQTGEEYLSVKLEAPEIGVIFGNVAQAPGGDPTKKVILWNNPN